MNKVLVISVAGFVLSLLVHLTTFFGVNLQALVPFWWILHIGIFVVWFPVILHLRKLKKLAVAAGESDGKRSGMKDFKRITRNCPLWWKIVLAVFFVYAPVNFISLMSLKEGGGPHIQEDGTKVLSNHGDVIRQLTDEEFEIQQAYDVRLFSGFWMLFYAFGIAVSYSAVKEKACGSTSVSPGIGNT